MLSFEPEIVAARDAGALDSPTAARLIAIERREIVPFSRELRALAWIGVMLIATGVGMVIKEHVHEIGALALATVIGASSIACYAVAARWESAVRDSIVLLGALLFSAAVAFIEAQWHLLDGEWQRQFLLVAVVHAIVAYAFDSRAVLSLSIAAFAAWMGIEQRSVFQTDIDMAVRAFLCAGTLAVWRAINRKAAFDPVFDHFAANIAFWGGLILTSNDDTRVLGLALTIVFAAASMVHGFRRRLELFVIYAIVYALVALNIAVFRLVDGETIDALHLVVSTIAAIVALVAVHFRLRKAQS